MGQPVDKVLDYFKPSWSTGKPEIFECFFLNDKNGYKANVNQEILQNYEIQSSSEIVRLFLLSKLMAYRGKN